MPTIANGSEDFLKSIIFWEICLKGTCRKLSVIFRIGFIIKNWPDRNKICKNKIDLEKNLKVNNAEIIVSVKVKILAFKTNPSSIILFTKPGISGSFIKTSQVLDINKTKANPKKIRVVKNQTTDLLFSLCMNIFALFEIKIPAAGVAGSQ